MSRVRVHSLTAVIPPGSAVRVHSLGATADGASRVRVHQLGATATSELVANAGLDQSVAGLDHFVLDGSASTGDIDAWEWTQDAGDDYQVTLSGAGSRYASADAPGPIGADTDLHFSLRVSDDGGSTWSDPADTVVTVARHRQFRLTDVWQAIRSQRLPVTTTHRQPTAVLGPNQNVTVGQLVTIGGDDIAPDGIIIGWEFAWVSGPTRPALQGQGPTRSFTPTSAGTYVFSKKVWDDYGTPSATVTVSITAVPASIMAKPDATNTGVPAGTTLTVHYGDLTLSTPGQVVENLDIRGRLLVKANDCTARNCIVRGPAGGLTKQAALVYAPADWQSGFLMEDCEVAPSSPNVFTNGIQGSNMTVRRVNVHGCTDGTIIFGGTNTVYEMYYVHDIRHYASDPAQGGGPSHDDGIQIEGGAGIRLSWINIEGNIDGNSAIQVTQNYAVINGLTVEHAWLSGGNIPLIASEKGRGPYTGFTLDTIVFGPSRNTSNVDAAIPSTTRAVMTATNLTKTDGSPAKVINA